MSNQSDEEQLELLKSLWKKYGQTLLLLTVITLAAVSGYSYWQKNQQLKSAEASLLYQNILDALIVDHSTRYAATTTEDQKATVNHLVTVLQKEHAGSLYSVLGTFFLAQQQVQDNQLNAARMSLEWILNQKNSTDVQAIASIRLARVLISDSPNNAQQALDMLNKLEVGKAYETSLASVKGDVYLALGDQEQAAAAYQNAITSAWESGQNRPFLQLKLDALAAMEPKEG